MKPICLTLILTAFSPLLAAEPAAVLGTIGAIAKKWDQEPAVITELVKKHPLAINEIELLKLP